MGLDMFLMAKKNFYCDNDSSDGEQEKIQSIFLDVPFKITQIKGEVIYWRKVNAIHNWFVKNVQNGIDDCEEYLVNREQLQNLFDLCVTVLENHDKAEELLPPVGGFFFGSILIDKRYFDSIEYTKTKLKEILDNKFENWEFYYVSSW